MAPNCFNNDQWEHGSEFHLMDYQSESAIMYPWQDNCLFLGSGRDSIRLLLNHGIQQRGWLRLWIPGYFCQEVVHAILSSGISVMVYDNNPFENQGKWNKLPLKAGDVILAVNYFGLGYQPDYTAINREQVEIIEDHTHDPWSQWAGNSQADWCIASLRKTLPIPDGGVLWSPRNLPLPQPVDFTTGRKMASLEKLAGMMLKKHYLDGLPVRKTVFRELAISGEDGIASGEISAMSPWTREMINTFPVESWRNKRICNYLRLAEQVKTCSWLEVPVDIPPGTCPISVPLVFDKPARRNYMRQRLIENSIYPTILWDLTNPVVDNISAETIDLSKRILCIHCDMRYAIEEIDYIGEKIMSYATEYSKIE